MKSRFSILCLLVNILLISCEQAPQYYEVSGRLHTPYHIKFEHTKPLDKEIDEQLKYFYHLFNAFDSTSVISQVNQNRDIRVDTLFQKVFKKALEVSAETNGAYDVTCAPLINLWGFGFSRKDSVTPAHIDSVRQFIGFQKVRLEGDRIVKDDPRLMMNFSSLADGTVCDMIAQMLEKKGVRNYLVEFGGFVLLFPGAHSRSVEPLVTSNKLFHTLDDSREWSKMLGIGTIGSLNDAIAAGRGQEIMLLQEALMEQKIGNLAAQIASDDKKKFIMIAGPSSSGKTSFANRLSIQLIAKGRKPHPLSLDDYYVDREFCPKHPDGSFDFECLESIDVKLFNEDMNRLLKGEAVDMPSFNFKTGKREYRGRKLTLGADDILVIEGIHGLNERLSQLIPPEHKFKIYISALTQLNIDEHNPLSTTDERLIRRIVRDARTRGTNAMETIAMWPSVRKGERENIFPFQEQADVMFNSALVYELAVLKVYAEPLLFGIERDCPEYLEAKRLLKLLDYFLPMPADGIPNNSLLREFVGGSCFNV